MHCFLVPVLLFALESAALLDPSQHEESENAGKPQYHIMDRMKELEAHLAHKSSQAVSVGHLLVNAPLPTDFSERFAQAVSHATGADARTVRLTRQQKVEEAPGIEEITFEAAPDVINAIENQAAEPNSKLSSGNLHSFLVAKESASSSPEKKAASKSESKAQEATPVQEKGIDIDTQMPYGDLEPFGREDTAQELTRAQ
jgi:hypothetical protein